LDQYGQEQSNQTAIKNINSKIVYFLHICRLLHVYYRLYLPHVWEIWKPMHVTRNCVEINEKSAKQQHRNRRYWRRKYCNLQTTTFQFYHTMAIHQSLWRVIIVVINNYYFPTFDDCVVI